MSAAEYTIRKRLFSFPDTKFEVFNADGDMVGFSRQKAFRLKEDIRVYRDDAQTEEWVVIKARSIIDFSAAYDVFVAADNEHIGTLRRKGMTSILRDEWSLLDQQGTPVGTIQEDSLAMALVRRFLADLVPQNFTLRDGEGNAWAEFRRHFNPFVQKMTVTVEGDCPLHPFLPLAAGILLVAIEGRQK
ncbi:hypothetical protein [Stratiformator vulcanicus]|uniref:Scramblase n=1 Tax=Stratiformator vulcanicus TaxID=2527980 RepID=A0A517QVZ4_9PLAN|nr:hypothetical protein [Stratiformator vulcanicus]QDT35811.1 hypothetical protein Pan189_01640 [Stratiformator vulcanicus]